MLSSIDGTFALDGADSLNVAPSATGAAPVHPVILLAEHDDESCETMMMALIAAGYRTSRVMDGTAALHFLRGASAPVILVADEGLPEFGGFQLAELLSLAYDAPVRFGAIVLTASLGEALRRPGRYQPEAVSLEMLVKPFHTNELLLAVGLAADQIATVRTQTAENPIM